MINKNPDYQQITSLVNYYIFYLFNKLDEVRF
jgi:hypothetical protein